LKPAEIADELHISVKTVETYREQIKTKLQLDTASELAQYAIAWARGEHH
jgi:DNA-binding NarL/FixJ family response regulator